MPVALEKAMRRITGGLALLGAAGVVLMLLHITVYVVMRHVASAPPPATVEIVSYYYMVMIAFLPIAWAERRGDMITVEVFQHLMPEAVKRWVNVLVALITFAAYIALTWTTWLVAMREFASRSFVISLSVALPTWPGYFVLPIAFALAAAVALYRAARVITKADPLSSDTKPQESFVE
jgi:TRAP-type C4-dicarboxylate transport system permease small subunit